MKKQNTKNTLNKKQYKKLNQKMMIFNNYKDILQRINNQGLLKKFFNIINQIFKNEILNIKSKLELTLKEQQIFLYQNLVIFKENLNLISKQIIDQIFQDFNNNFEVNFENTKNLEIFKSTKDNDEIPNFVDKSISGIEQSEEEIYSLEEEQTSPRIINIDNKKSPKNKIKKKENFLTNKITISQTEPKNQLSTQKNKKKSENFKKSQKNFIKKILFKQTKSNQRKQKLKQKKI